MWNEHLKSIKEQLKLAEQRKESLLLWFDENSYSDPAFESQLSKLRAAECKVDSLKGRLSRQITKKKTGGIPALSALIVALHYSF